MDWQLTVINRGLCVPETEWLNLKESVGFHKLEFADTFGHYPRSTICYDGSASTEIRNGLSKESTFARLK